MTEETGKTEMVEPEPKETPEAKPQNPVDAGPKAEELQAELEKARKALKDANKEAAERRKKLEEYEKAEADRKAAEMTEVEKAQARAKELEGKLTEYETKIRDSERRELQRKVSEAVGLPPVFASRIVGEDEEAMTADAKAILEALPKPEAKDTRKTPTLNVTNPANGQKGETTAQQKERLGLGNVAGPFNKGSVTWVESKD